MLPPYASCNQPRLCIFNTDYKTFNLGTVFCMEYNALGPLGSPSSIKHKSQPLLLYGSSLYWFLQTSPYPNASCMSQHKSQCLKPSNSHHPSSPAKLYPKVLGWLGSTSIISYGNQNCYALFLFFKPWMLPVQVSWMLPITSRISDFTVFLVFSLLTSFIDRRVQRYVK